MDQYGKPLLVLNFFINGECVSDTFRIDTGFDGELAIPKDIVERYRIRYHEYIRWKLPTGQKVEFPLIKTKIMLDNIFLVSVRLKRKLLLFNNLSEISKYVYEHRKLKIYFPKAICP